MAVSALERWIGFGSFLLSYSLLFPNNSKIQVTGTGKKNKFRGTNGQDAIVQDANILILHITGQVAK